MRERITTKEVADRFSCSHRYIRKKVIKMIEDGYHLQGGISDSTYITMQNKRVHCHLLSVAAYASLVDSSMFSDSEHKLRVKSQIAKEMGLKSIQVVRDKSRCEEQFSDMLERFIPEIKFDRQFSVLQYRLDFYSRDYNLVVEYDEEQHENPSHKKRDKQREAELSRQIKKDTGSKPCLIRVRKGSEIEGLRSIMAFAFRNRVEIDMRIKP